MASLASTADLPHHFELWTALECLAVHLAAQTGQRDVRSVRAVFPEFNQQVLAPYDQRHWHRLERQLHHAISQQSGNSVLARMVARISGDLQATYLQRVSQPIHRPGTLWLLHCQHRKILSCIEAGQPADAVWHTRSHLHLIRDQVMAALQHRTRLVALP